MSVFAYVGFPGSGKSYSVVEHQILPALRAGRTVVTNMPMKSDLLRAEVKTHDGKECDIRSFDISRALADPNTILEDVPAGAIWVVDECYKLFPAGIAVAKVPDAFKQILAEHRHRVNSRGDAMQVVFVCQDLAQIAAFARQLVETTFRTTKLTAVGLHKRFRVDVFNGPQPGPNPPVSARLREIAGKYDSKVYRYYISHTLSESGKEGANEVAVDRRANVLLRPMILIAPVVMLVLVGFAVHHLVGRKEDVLHPGQAAKSAIIGMNTLRPPVAVGAAGSLVSAPISGAPGRGWVLRGYIQNVDHPERSLAVLADGKDVLSRPLKDCVLEDGEYVCAYHGVSYGPAGPVGASLVAALPYRPYSSVGPGP